ncbi:hypothetical protein Ciccas_006141 [Cichlidogyrus casuarinus]|uniref:C2H2-type domain-containing protein n=1 Tax=Cichlidogyrus casuarinus TaxID=1844966 RepID=A0ABD2Q6M9_9PLAT
MNKLNKYSSYHVIMEVSGVTSTSRKFSCALCTYSSVHSLADVRKHIMGSHCGISPKKFRLLLRASRHDSTSYRLCPDDRMLQFVELHQRRTEGVASSLVSGGSGNASVKNGGDTKGYSNPSSVRTSDSDEEEAFDSTSNNEGSNFGTPLANEVEASTPIKSLVTATQSGFSFPTKSPSKDDIALLMKEVVRLQGHVNNPAEGTDFYTNSGTLIQLRLGEVITFLPTKRQSKHPGLSQDT